MSHVPHLRFGSLCPGPSQGTMPVDFCSHCLPLQLLLLGALWANFFPGISGHVPGCNVCCCLLPSPRATPRRARHQCLSSPLEQPLPARNPPFTVPSLAEPCHHSQTLLGQPLLLLPVLAMSREPQGDTEPQQGSPDADGGQTPSLALLPVPRPG